MRKMKVSDSENEERNRDAEFSQSFIKPHSVSEMWKINA